MLALTGTLLILAGWERCATGGGFNVMTGLYAIGAGIAVGVAQFIPPGVVD